MINVNNKSKTSQKYEIQIKNLVYFISFIEIADSIDETTIFPDKLVFYVYHPHTKNPAPKYFGTGFCIKLNAKIKRCFLELVQLVQHLLAFLLGEVGVALTLCAIILLYPCVCQFQLTSLSLLRLLVIHLP